MGGSFAATILLSQLYKWEADLLYFHSCINGRQICFTFTAVQMGGRFAVTELPRVLAVTIVYSCKCAHFRIGRHSRVTLVLTSQACHSCFDVTARSLLLRIGCCFCLSFTRVRELDISTTVCLIQGLESSQYHCLSYTRVREVSVPLFVLYKG